MTFQPRMSNKIDGFAVLNGPNRRHWNGVAVDLWDVACAPGAGGYYVGADPRLLVILEAPAFPTSQLAISTRKDERFQLSDHRAMSYIPANMEIWAHMTHQSRIRHIDFHFNIDDLAQRLMEDVDSTVLAKPRLQFFDPRIYALAELVAQECVNPNPLHDLYGDGLTVALFIDLMQIGKRKVRKRSQLAAWQMRRTVDYLEANCLRSVRLQELADLTGLSQSHFSHAFKASTGVAPHQWQMRARIEKVKYLLSDGTLPLATIAVETGFTDQAHFTKVFRRIVGTTPAHWQKSHRR